MSAETFVPNEAMIALAERQRAEVIALCERVGYGFTIDVAVREWDAKLEREWGIRHHCAGWISAFAKILRKERTLSVQRAKDE